MFLDCYVHIVVACCVLTRIKRIFIIILLFNTVITSMTTFLVKDYVSKKLHYLKLTVCYTAMPPPCH